MAKKFYNLKLFCIKIQPRTTPDAAIAYSSQDHTKENTTELVMNCRCRRDHWFFGKTQIQRISVNWNKYCQLGGSNPETLSLYHLGFQFKGLIAVWLLVLKKKVVQSSNRNKLFNHTHFGSHTKSKDQFTSRIHYNSIASEPIFIGCCFVVLPNFRAHRRPSKLSWQAQDPFLPKRPIQNLRSRHI